MIPRTGGRLPCVARDTEAEVVLVREGRELARWSLSTARRHPLCTIDELARLQLGARRLGCSVRLRRVDPRLRELLELAGLDEVLPTDEDPPMG
jgi:ABC-type transporter Mla MlaB component